MQLYRLSCTVFLFIILSTASHAATIYYVVTGQSNANTTVDSDHEDQWLGPSLSGSATCLATTCQTFSSLFFDPTFDWELGGGRFTLKTNGSTTDDITLTLWEGLPSGTVASPIGTQLASVTILSGSVPNAYASIDFLFGAPATLLTGHQYVLTLTSNTGNNGSEQYFIKGVDTLSVEDSGGNTLTEAAPEPSTAMLLIAGATAGLLGRKLKKR